MEEVNCNFNYRDSEQMSILTNVQHQTEMMGKTKLIKWGKDGIVIKAETIFLL